MVIDVNWDNLEVGMSIFIPAVNLPELKKQVKDVAKALQITLKHADRIESGRLGVRFWRIL